MSLQADEDEHSIEMHLPYLAKVINKFTTYIDLLSIIGCEEHYSYKIFVL